MSLAFCILLLSILMPYPASGQSAGAAPLDQGQREAQRVSFLERFFQEERLAYVKRELPDNLGASLVATIPRDSAAGDQDDGGWPLAYIIAVPLSRAEEAEDRIPFGMLSALRLITALQQSGPARETIIAFLGNQNPQAALDDLFSVMGNPEDAAFLYLAVFSLQERMVLHYRSEQIKTPRVMIQSLIAGLTEGGIPFALAGGSGDYVRQTFFYPEPEKTLLLQRALEGALPALFIQGASTSSSQQSELLEEESQATPFADSLIAFLHSLEQEAGNMDTHYMLIDLMGNAVFITDRGVMALILLALSFAFGSLLLNTAFLPRSSRYFWAEMFGSIALAVEIILFFLGVLIEANNTPIFIWALLFSSIGSIIAIPQGVFICLLPVIRGSLGMLLYFLNYSGPWQALRTLRPILAAGIALPLILLILRGIWLTLVHATIRRRIRESIPLPASPDLMQ